MSNLPNIEVRNNGSYAVPAKAYRVRMLLAAGVEQRITTPTDAGQNKKATYVVFSSTASFYAAYTLAESGSDVVATTAAGNTTDGTAEDLNPTFRSLSDVTKISLLSDAGGVVVMTFYIGG